MKKIIPMILISAFFGLSVQTAIADIDGSKLFKKKCAMCHAVDKKKVGPALKDMNRDPEALKATITNGRKMMPKFGKKLDEVEIDALVKYIRSTQAQPSDASAPAGVSSRRATNTPSSNNRYMGTASNT